MHGEGDILIHLTTMGYKLNYQQVSGFAVLLYQTFFFCVFGCISFFQEWYSLKFCLDIVRLF